MLFLAMIIAQEVRETGDGKALINKSIYNEGQGGSPLSKSHLNSMSQRFLQLPCKQA